jgi:hypothetical protein
MCVGDRKQVSRVVQHLIAMAIVVVSVAVTFPPVLLMLVEVGVDGLDDVTVGVYPSEDGGVGERAGDVCAAATFSTTSVSTVRRTLAFMPTWGS